MKEDSVAGSEPIVQRFIEMLTTQPSAEACQTCLNHLDDYVSAQLNGQDVVTLFPDTAVHLDTCLVCAEAYALIYQLRIAEEGDELMEPSVIPKPDLSFMAANSSLSLLLKQHLSTTLDSITLQLTQSLLPLLQPLPQAAPVRSAAGRYADVLYSLTPEHAPDITLPFSLTAYKDLQNTDLCLIEITVSPPGMSWPDLEGFIVQLVYDEHTISETTDDWGTAIFPDIPIAWLYTISMTIETP